MRNTFHDRLQRLHSRLRREWKPGDRCLSYDLRSETSVERVEGEVVYLANGDSMHWSKVRPVGHR